MCRCSEFGRCSEFCRCQSSTVVQSFAVVQSCETEGDIIECPVVQSFDGIFASSSNSCVRSTPNLSPKILRAGTVPPIGTSINACYGSDIGLFTRKKARS